MSWPRIKLKSLLSSRPQSINPHSYPSEVFALYSIPGFDRRKPDTVSGSEVGSAKQILYPGDVLLSKIVPHIRRCWVVGNGPPAQRQIGSGEWIVFRSELVDPVYLSKVLVGDEFHRAFMGTVAGVGGSLVRARPAAVGEIAVPLPPLNEQRRIAAILDMADELRRDRLQSIRLNETLLRSLFLEMFGDPQSNPAGWDCCSLEELCGKIIDCPHNTPVYSDTPTSFFCVRSSDIQNGKIDLNSTKQVSQVVFEERTARHEPRAGEVIYTREGGRLGYAAQVPPGKRICLGQRMMLFSAKEGAATNAFLHGLLNSVSFRRRVLNLVGGGAAPRVNIKDLRALIVYKPPIELQQRYDRASKLLVEQEQSFSESATQITRLFSSLQQRAFRGELDLSRLVLAARNASPAATEIKKAKTGSNSEPTMVLLAVPDAMRGALKKLDDDLKRNDAIPWSADYFKYRILYVQPVPFTFEDVMQRAATVFEEAPYEEIKDILFDLLGKGASPALLRQSFELEADGGDQGEGRKGIVFVHAI